MCRLSRTCIVFVSSLSLAKNRPDTGKVTRQISCCTPATVRRLSTEDLRVNRGSTIILDLANTNTRAYFIEIMFGMNTSCRQGRTGI